MVSFTWSKSDQSQLILYPYLELIRVLSIAIFIGNCLWERHAWVCASFGPYLPQNGQIKANTQARKQTLPPSHSDAVIYVSECLIVNIWVVQFVLTCYYVGLFILSRRSRQRERLSASVLSICSSVCLFVCLSVAKMQKNAIFSKTKQFRAMVSIDDL